MLPFPPNGLLLFPVGVPCIIFLNVILDAFSLNIYISILSRSKSIDPKYIEPSSEPPYKHLL
nr:MAG TPA: hypothetical protein [Crassvirales sp.]